MKNYYITTAIYYANGAPHLGHASEMVMTDVIARYRRLMGENAYYLTGLDEHGQKVQQSASKRGIEPRQFVNEVAGMFEGLTRKLLISNDYFIRTTEPKHQQVVQKILSDLYDKDEIYKADYKGFYSIRQEQFVQEKEKDENGEWPEAFGQVVELTESNYFFKLSKYQTWLVDFLKTHEDFIYPRFRQKQVLEFLSEPVNDLCISRPKERLSWGIPLPFDDDYVAYVWFDALINYVTGAGFGTDRFEHYWPADLHVIGKDILVPSHSVYWPIMLKASGIPLPKSILVHGFWSLKGEKMSKSTGVTINPLDLADQYGPDAFRYFVTREMNVAQDAEFSLELFMSRYTSDLGNDLGNLVSRLLNMGGRYCEQKIPAATVEEDPEKELKELWEKTREDIYTLFDGMQFHTALDRVITFVRGINRYAEVRAPWKLAKSESADDRLLLETALANMAEGIRLASAALAPVMPGTSERIHGLLGMPAPVLWEKEFVWDDRLKGKALGKKTILFPRPQ